MANIRAMKIASLSLRGRLIKSLFFCVLEKQLSVSVGFSLNADGNDESAREISARFFAHHIKLK